MDKQDNRFYREATTQDDERMAVAVGLLQRCAEGFGAFIHGRKMARKERDALRSEIADFLAGVRVCRQHKAHAGCWCGPTIEHIDQDTGVAVYVHKEVQ